MRIASKPQRVKVATLSREKPT